MSSKYLFSKSLKEVRFLFCQTSQHSAALRSFLVKSYPVMKTTNPDVPILLREAAGTAPIMYARHEFGKETSQGLDGLSNAQIEEAVTRLIKEK